LCSFLEIWNTLVMVVSNFVSSSNTLKFHDVFGVILSKEMRWKNTCETSGNALTMDNRERQKDRGKVSGNHWNSRKGISKSRRGNIECWNCGKKGHLKKYYRAPTKRWTEKEKSGSKCNR
jgi:hypothetical protein